MEKKDDYVIIINNLKRIEGKPRYCNYTNQEVDKTITENVGT